LAEGLFEIKSSEDDDTLLRASFESLEANVYNPNFCSIYLLS